MVGSGGRGRALVVRVFLVIVLMRCLQSAGQYPACSVYALYIDIRDLPVNLAFSKRSIDNIITYSILTLFVRLVVLLLLRSYLSFIYSIF